ncbi:MAG TPA: NADPH:quinone reductase [Planctomycetota bacterium]
MKAIRVSEFGPPSVLKLLDVPTPAPGPGEILVRVKAVGVNPVDTYIRDGAYRKTLTPPYTPGSDAGGVVEAVGADTNLKPGDRVYTSGTTAGGFNGAYAELTVCRVNQVHRLPERLSFAQGAAINVPYATAWRALLQRASGRPGETVLVHGASGGVGTAAVQIARAQGFTVIGTGGSDKGRELVRRNGAHHVVDHKNPKYLEQVLDLTGGKGVDIILEMLSNVNLGKDLGVLAKAGRVVVIGSRGTVEINPRDTMMRDAAIFGMALANASDVEIASIHAALGAAFEQGTLTPVVREELPLAEAARAHERVLEPGAYGKIVLVP